MREIKKFKRVLAANRGAGNPSGRRKRLPGGGAEIAPAVAVYGRDLFSLEMIARLGNR